MSDTSLRLIAILCAAMLTALDCSAAVRQRSESEARAIATHFLHREALFNRHPSAQPALVRINRLWQPNGNMAAGRAVTPYYIYTTEEHRGFVVVAGIASARRILGYSTDAVVDANGALPCGMEAWLDDMVEQMDVAMATADEPDDGSVLTDEEEGEGNVVCYLGTAEWHQRAPFNALLPWDADRQCAVGCVPLVYAEIMRHYQYPQQGRGTTPLFLTRTRAFRIAERELAHAYLWPYMPLTLPDTDLPTDVADMLAELLADLGAAFQVDYLGGETAGALGRTELFTYFDYNPGTRLSRSNYAATDWHTKLQTTLQAQHPVVYRAENSGGGSHAFIIDGYTDRNYYHVNWGWGGSYNGYFSLDAMEVSTRNYNKGQAAYFDFMPMPLYNGPMVVEVDGVASPSLALALSAAVMAEGHLELKLLIDTEVTTLTIAAELDVVLNLNGNTLTTTGSVRNDGVLTIVDPTGRGGIYTSEGNHAIVSNYGRLTIEGGSYVNAGPEPTGTDYRRVIFTSADSETTLKGGTYVNASTTQTMCFNGKATLYDCDVSNRGTGYAIASFNATGVDIESGRYSASRLLYTSTGSKLRCRGGLFTAKVSATFLPEGYVCIANEDEATRRTYPYHVASASATIAPKADAVQASSPTRLYNAAGQRISSPQGLHIMTSDNAASRKRVSIHR